MKKTVNKMKLEITAESVNEGFARSVVAAFAAQLDPTVDEIGDLKTAISEAVTNSIVHSKTDRVLIECQIWNNQKENSRGICVKITDFGIGIANIEKAMQPFYTTKPEQERSGMGFTVMQSFMDTLNVAKGTNCGTIVEMTKTFGKVG
jgi:stage II sporulation protein AB (anti-sigma F factor)